MSDLLTKPVTAFAAHRLLSAGPLVEVALAVKAANESDSTRTVLVFDDSTGRVIDLDLRGTKADVIERLSQPPRPPAGRYRPRAQVPTEPSADRSTEPKGRGRPKLGVVAREVTLLPRQWEWLAEQPGGASAVLRRLVDDARKNGGSRQQRRTAQDTAYQFMLAIAGDFPDYEEATRALFADDRAGLEQRLAAWPEDIRQHVLRLAFDPQNNAR
ncbi:DUF2239 family protein [Pseudomonas asplenii]|uniref:DUF2239 family protein n=1 Tax=Pseudomonas asplenii TaxID=53407 RepID=UPI00039D3075|nr:DUF2239 family protein [Pseudomonas fuscovaginae]